MKRFLVLCILLLCIIPLASATVHTWTVSQLNENEGVRNSLVIDRSGQANITSLISLEIRGCAPYTGYNPLYDKSGTFELKNQTNTTLATGAYSSEYEDVNNPNCPYAGTMWHEYTFSNYSNAYPALTDTWKVYYSDGIGYYGDGAVSADTETWKSKFTPRDFGSISGAYTFTYIATNEPPPEANFTASPLNTTAPAYIAFTDTSTNKSGTCTYNWSFSPDTGIFASVGGLEQESPTIYFTEEGNYTVTHGIDCYGKSDIETKTDYIRIINSTGIITTCFAAIDALSGFQLSGANFQMYDIQNTSWTNKTASSTGSECISTLSGHTINAYTDMLGYDDGELLAVTPRASPDYPILMFPANSTNVSAGNVTLHVTVRDMYAPGLPISGAQVDMTYNFPATEQQITGASGMVSFVVPNQTTIYLAAQKSGYSGQSVSVDSGTGSGGDASISTTIYLPLKTVTTAPTATTLPGGGTPTPQVTYLPHCDPSAADYDEALCRASKGGVGLNLLADYMDDLILLCIFVTIMYLLGFKLGG